MMREHFVYQQQSTVCTHTYMYIYKQIYSDATGNKITRTLRCECKFHKKDSSDMRSQSVRHPAGRRQAAAKQPNHSKEPFLFRGFSSMMREHCVYQQQSTVLIHTTYIYINKQIYFYDARTLWLLVVSTVWIHTTCNICLTSYGTVTDTSP